jgi:hypothetical protein
MKWLEKIWGLLTSPLWITMKFTLIDFEDSPHEISANEVHTVIQDTYTIYIIYKKEGTYSIFPNTASNRAALPKIRLAEERKFK